MSDRMTARLFEIMSLLLEESDFLTLQALAAKMGVSKRTVQYDIDRLEAWLEQNGLTDQVTVCKKPGNGLRLELHGISSEELSRRMEDQYGGSELNDNYQRRLEITKFLLFSHDDLTIQFLADHFYISKSVVQKDITWVDKWLLQYGLCVTKRQNRGITIVGSEQKRRAAMAGLIELLRSVDGEKDGQQQVPVSDTVDIIRLDLERFYSGMNNNPKADVGKIAEIIQDAERKFGFYLMDSYYTGLLVHLSIAVERLIGGRSVTESEDPLKGLLSCREGEIARYIASEMEQAFHIKMPESECTYICIHVMGAELPDPTAEQSQLHSSRIRDFTTHLVSFVQDMTGIQFLQDSILLNALATHIKASAYRLRSGLRRQGHHPSHFTPEYARLYHAVWSSSYYYKQFFSVEPNAEELLSIYLHFVQSIRRRMRRCKAIYLYQSDVICAEEVFGRLKALSDDVDIVDMCSWNQLSSSDLEQYDLVITTAQQTSAEVPVITVSTPVTDSQLDAIRGQANEIRTRIFRTETPLKPENANIIWFPLAHKNIENVFEVLFDLLTRHGFSSAALSRESLEMERDGRILILNSTALIPIYLPDINQFCAYGFILPSPISVGTGTASRIIYLLLNEPGEHDQRGKNDSYPAFIHGILRYVELKQWSGTIQTEKEDEGDL